MPRPIKIFIFGSCISRDPFEFADEKDFKVVNYYARSSLASLGAAPKVDERILKNIDSKWQCKMVRADMQKSIFDNLLHTQYDFILLDLIDERFNIAILGDSVHTVSSEYKKALYKPNGYTLVKAWSKEKLGLWSKGLDALIKYLVDNDLDKKLIVNKVFWSLNCPGSKNLLERYTVDSVSQANETLRWMYDELVKRLPSLRFITYTEEELELDEHHKWGLEPFHYSRKAFYKQLATIYTFALSNIDFTIRHQLGEKKVSFPINWKMNPFDSRAWLHHFVSLRWLHGGYFFILNVLLSFYRAHCLKKISNPYYNSIRGDHTAAIRLDLFLIFKLKYTSNPFLSLSHLVNRLIIEEAKNLQNPKMYRVGHNHGLMVDISLLKLISHFPVYRDKIDFNILLERSAKTVDAMWDNSGLTKEHSVSYQEFNIPLTIEYFQLIRKLGLHTLSQVQMSSIFEESRRFLGYALKSSGEYFPLGDSFRLPNLNILNQVFGQAPQKQPSVFQLLAPYSFEDGCYANDHFFIFRKTLNGKRVHFAATCCCDSKNHKQNDEMSFCLDIDGVSLLDDPGYTEFADWGVIQFLKSEQAHSTFCLENNEWSKPDEYFAKSFLSGYETEDGFFLKMQSERVFGVVFSREMRLENNNIYISDNVVLDLDLEKHSRLDFLIKRRFLFSKDISVEVVDSESRGREVLIFNHSGLLAKISNLNPTAIFSKELVPFVNADRKIIVDTVALAFTHEISDFPSRYNISW